MLFIFPVSGFKVISEWCIYTSLTSEVKNIDYLISMTWLCTGTCMFHVASRISFIYQFSFSNLLTLVRVAVGKSLSTMVFSVWFGKLNSFEVFKNVNLRLAH